jgi:predicted SprT family Zn-dependent metalloprotease
MPHFDYEFLQHMITWKVLLASISGFKVGSKMTTLRTVRYLQRCCWCQAQFATGRRHAKTCSVKCRTQLCRAQLKPASYEVVPLLAPRSCAVFPGKNRR